MPKPLLILQFRTDISREHEQDCFREELSSEKDHLEFRSAINNEFPDDVTQYAGTILAGSGEFMLGEGAGLGSWREKTFQFIQTLLDHDIPTLGICFGYQLIALQQGARIVNTEDMRETGTFTVHVNEEGMNDPLFQNMPQSFEGQFGHKETIVDAPSDVIPLASTDRVQLNSFHVQGKRMWGTLMHPELTPARMRERISMFPVYQNGRSLDDVLSAFHESPDASKILRNFLSHVYIEEALVV